MIPQRNISLITNELATESSRRIPEAIIERDYVLAWFLTCMADHPLRAANLDDSLEAPGYPI